MSRGTSEAPKGPDMRNLTRAQKARLSHHRNGFYDSKEIDLKHHRLRCDICRHRSRDLIEEAFLQWRSPRTIMNAFEIKSQTTIYHHAHAFKLFAIRDRNLRYALGNMIEDADTVNISTAQDVVRAAYAFAHIDDEGRWVHPTNKSEVVVSASRAPGLPTGSLARCDDGAAPGQPRLAAASDDGWHPATLASPLGEVRDLPAPTAASDSAPEPPGEAQSIASVRKSENDANH